MAACLCTRGVIGVCVSVDRLALRMIGFMRRRRHARDCAPRMQHAHCLPHRDLVRLWLLSCEDDDPQVRFAKYIVVLRSAHFSP